MKGIILIGIAILTTGCCNTGVVEYQQVSVVPIRKVAPPVVSVVTKVRVIPARPIVTRVITPTVTPVLVDYAEPIDVTTTGIDYY